MSDEEDDDERPGLTVEMEVLVAQRAELHEELTKVFEKFTRRYPDFRETALAMTVANVCCEHAAFALQAAGLCAVDVDQASKIALRTMVEMVTGQPLSDQTQKE